MLKNVIPFFLTILNRKAEGLLQNSAGNCDKMRHIVTPYHLPEDFISPVSL